MQGRYQILPPCITGRLCELPDGVKECIHREIRIDWEQCNFDVFTKMVFEN
jgi:hypothetical protein